MSCFWGPILLICSGIYGLVVRLRRFLFQSNIVRGKKLTCKVIAVGNITLGGTGKTPAVIQIAGMLKQQQRHPVVVSRGYGRVEESEIITVSDGLSVLVDSRIGGDEPVLIGSRLRGVPVMVCRNRYKAALQAIDRFQPDVIVLDDAFQHLRLKRDLDIVLVDASDPFGNGKLFPAGILREPLSALQRADAVLITNYAKAQDIQGLMGTLQKKTSARIFTANPVPIDLIECSTGASKPLTSLFDLKVLALSGIARPGYFTSLLISLGANVLEKCIYPDHHEYTQLDLVEINRKSIETGADMIITTEKDAVRLMNLDTKGIWALRITMGVSEQAAWDEFIIRGLDQ